MGHRNQVAQLPLLLDFSQMFSQLLVQNGHGRYPEKMMVWHCRSHSCLSEGQIRA
jgi:hypothetical protein